MRSAAGAASSGISLAAGAFFSKNREETRCILFVCSFWSLHSFLESRIWLTVSFANVSAHQFLVRFIIYKSRLRAYILCREKRRKHFLACIDTQELFTGPAQRPFSAG